MPQKLRQYKKFIPSPGFLQYVVKGILCDILHAMLPAGDEVQTTIFGNWPINSFLFFYDGTNLITI
jgi:hypothetical protein